MVFFIILCSMSFFCRFLVVFLLFLCYIEITPNHFQEEENMKKYMKRTLALAFALMLVLVMAGCGGPDMSDSPYIGTWNATAYQALGMTLTPDSLGASSLDLQSNGKVTVTITDQEIGTCNWEETETGIVIKDSKDSLELTNQEGSLVLDYEGLIIYFEMTE